MAGDEWEQLKASAAGKGLTQMQLSGKPDEDKPNAGDPVGDLNVRQQDLAKIGDQAVTL
ncbi:hypothetical protein OG317_27405 [Streptomyces sp. NBC_01167]|uniref:hypothetical protein n=1 Tax=Streptomyces sp. NBC_01167 TaxID=2903756 RepID=UPI0038694559|nr:hypothetical protein OG317_27405 [Streptomyces sp. NBC_01167]